MNVRGRGATADGRGRVLREAQALFTASGFAEVSMQQIADATGMTKAALYYHFRDKEDLFGHVVLAEFERVRAGLAVELDGPGALRQRLVAAATYLMESARSDFGRLLSDLKEHVAAAHRAEIQCQTPMPHEVLLPHLERAVVAGELRTDLNLDLLASSFFSLVFGQVMHTRHGDGMPPPVAGVAASLVEVFLHGAGARDGA